MDLSYSMPCLTASGPGHRNFAGSLQFQNPVFLKHLTQGVNLVCFAVSSMTIVSLLTSTIFAIKMLQNIRYQYEFLSLLTLIMASSGNGRNFVKLERG